MYTRAKVEFFDGCEVFQGWFLSCLLADKKRTGKHYCFPVRISWVVRHGVLYCDCDIPQPPQW
jgi:hypothetical protein